MGGFIAQINGLSELEENLLNLSAKAANNATTKALVAGGKVIRAAIAERAPIRPLLPSGTALPPGALATDIELAVGKDQKGLPMVVISPGKRTAHVAEWVEYGHRLVRGGYSKRKGGKAQGPGREIGHVSAHPFIRPGYEASIAEAVEVEQKVFVEEIEKALAKE